MREDDEPSGAHHAWLSASGSAERPRAFLTALLRVRRRLGLVTGTACLGAAAAWIATIIPAGATIANLDIASVLDIQTLAAPSAWQASPVGAGAAGGLLVGAALAQVVQGIKDSVATTRDIAGKTDLRPLGAAPKADSRLMRRLSPDERNGAGLVVGAPASRFAQSYRDLFASIVKARRTKPIQVVAVTASYIGEDAAIAYLALARTAALAGERVIMVDCDVRARVLSRLTQADSGEGLEAVIGARRSWREVVAPDTQTSAAIIGIGAARDLLADLFTSQKFADLVAELRAAHDLVVLVCPPVLAAVDARMVAQLADASVLFVRSGGTMTGAVVNGAHRRLLTSHTDILGAFLVDAAPETREDEPV